MPTRFRLTRTVAFSETDAAGIVHFSNFFRYMEDAEHAMLRDFGLSVHRDIGDDVAGFPRVSAQCDYRKPLKFEDVFTIEVHVQAKTDKSVTYGFTFTKEGTEGCDDGQGKAHGFGFNRCERCHGSAPQLDVVDAHDLVVAPIEPQNDHQQDCPKRGREAPVE